MPVLQCLVEARVQSARVAAADLQLLREVREGRRPPVVHVYTLAGDTISLGRYRVAPSPDAAVGLQRRIAGGRVLPSGDGFVHLSLILPRRGALLAEGETFAGHRLMNRYVRGVLAGLRTLGLDALYPGRDLLTRRGRAVGAVALEVEEQGGSLFEALLAVNTSFDVLPALLDRGDPEGVVMTAPLAPAEASCLARERGAAADLDEVAAALAGGFAAYFDASLEATELRGPEIEALERCASADWTAERSRRPDLDHRGVAWGQLGLLEVWYSQTEEVLGAVMVCGDFIANSPALRRIEAALRGCSRTAAAIDRALATALHEPDDFVLGLGSLALIRDAILRGAKW